MSVQVLVWDWGDTEALILYSGSQRIKTKRQNKETKPFGINVEAFLLHSPMKLLGIPSSQAQNSDFINSFNRHSLTPSMCQAFYSGLDC